MVRKVLSVGLLLGFVVAACIASDPLEIGTAITGASPSGGGEKVTICHCVDDGLGKGVEDGCVTITVSAQGAEGHLAQHTADCSGPCPCNGGDEG
jgi:hypothetical protein